MKVLINLCTTDLSEDAFNELSKPFEEYKIFNFQFPISEYYLDIIDTIMTFLSKEEDIKPYNSKTNIEIAEAICSLLDEVLPFDNNEKGLTSYKQLIEFVQDRPGHDFRYAIDDSKFIHEFGGQTIRDFKESLL